MHVDERPGGDELADQSEAQGEEEPWSLTKTEWDRLTEQQQATLKLLEQLEANRTATTSATPSTSPKPSASEKPNPPEPTATLDVETVQIAEAPNEHENPPDALPDDHAKPASATTHRKRKRLF